jgi:hypothetical protein
MKDRADGLVKVGFFEIVIKNIDFIDYWTAEKNPGLDRRFTPFVCAA